ncbi:TetR/AcrR family transcriptional repressor of nem operon [Nocardia transvalensis]|uniref:TetR/AcrR family transcriptional repressor of nem operon n=1 Tax=Nocardia transvalensis TaxID=37333 RepID=A0A7W9UNC6_9NOCA|nr:TetR/AcrR family transcriptional regulator [Nocardia transvalensis]MBB5918690.1 TetR/AcrR family transcriptional repressor of nem operon [Nocardia transvalensis]
MPRTSRAQAESHRREVLDAAAAQVRERGTGAVTVPEVMAAAGLTHGGFYRHFRSKEDLVAQACTAAYVEKIREMEQIRADSPDGPAARRTFIERYLSPAHRDAAGQGCGIAALAGDVARTDAESPLRHAYLDGIRTMLGKLAEFGDHPAADDPEVLLELSVMAGALMLSRASADDALSGRILDAAMDFLLRGGIPAKSVPGKE